MGLAQISSPWAMNCSARELVVGERPDVEHRGERDQDAEQRGDRDGQPGPARAVALLHAREPRAPRTGRAEPAGSPSARRGEGRLVPSDDHELHAGRRGREALERVPHQRLPQSLAAAVRVTTIVSTSASGPVTRIGSGSPCWLKVKPTESPPSSSAISRCARPASNFLELLEPGRPALVGRNERECAGADRLVVDVEEPPRRLHRRQVVARALPDLPAARHARVVSRWACTESSRGCRIRGRACAA